MITSAADHVAHGGGQRPTGWWRCPNGCNDDPGASKPRTSGDGGEQRGGASLATEPGIDRPCDHCGQPILAGDGYQEFRLRRPHAPRRWAPAYEAVFHMPPKLCATPDEISQTIERRSGLKLADHIVEIRRVDPPGYWS